MQPLHLIAGQVLVRPNYAEKLPTRYLDRVERHARVGAMRAWLHDDAALQAKNFRHREIVLDGSGRRRVPALFSIGKYMRRPPDVKMRVPTPSRRFQPRR